MATLTIADLDNGKRDLQTVEQVANSPNDTTVTRYGDNVLTLAGALRRLGYKAPVPYASGLAVDSGLFTVSKDGVIYAPDPALVPFTTGAWNAAQWRPVQNTANTNQVYQFPTLGAAQSAAATLPEGSAVVVDGASQGHVTGGAYIAEAGVPAIVFQDYAAMDAYTGKSSVFQIKKPGIAGFWAVIVGDTTSAGNVGTLRVLADGRRVQRLYSGDIMAPWFEITGDGDETEKVSNLLNALENNQTVNFCGISVKVFEGVTGSTSGNATAINKVPRLFGKTGVTLKNGGIYAANPAVSPSVVRFPTTLTIDGCNLITLDNFSTTAKGESFGDSDASAPLGFEERRAFCAVNGGHALLICRSRGTTVNSGRFRLAGSTGVVYSMSSSETVINGAYSSAESLGYAAYAADSWAGPSSVSGFAEHDTLLINCRSDKGSATYGSKGCIVAEDQDVVVRVQGGVFKDAYPSGGGGETLGAAFHANVCSVYVDSAYVENCAAVSGGRHSAGGLCLLDLKNVTAKKLRTSVHIEEIGAFGTTQVSYSNSDFSIDGGGYWPGIPELSVATVVANRKTSTSVNVDFFNCTSVGAHTFSVNSKACYGGIRISGGHHSVSDRLFDSAGWGGSSANSGRGFSVEGAARINFTGGGSTAITASTAAFNAIKNIDSSSVLTYQYVDFDSSCSFESTGGFIGDLAHITVTGSALREKLILSASLSKMYQTFPTGSDLKSQNVVVSSLDGVAGSNVMVTFKLPSGIPFVEGSLVLVDDSGKPRIVSGVLASPSAVGAEVFQKVYLSGADYHLTVGKSYSAVLG